jgi:uncharacterized protein YdaT
MMALMRNYTVLFDETDSKWIVRRHGSVKRSDVFDTQAEAVARAKDLANKSGGSVNIMNKEGKVRAQALKSNKK